jgi:hypothetical protein
MQMNAISLLYKKKFLTFKNEIFKIKKYKKIKFFHFHTRPQASGKFFFGIDGFFFSVKFKKFSHARKKNKFQQAETLSSL